MSPEGRSQNYVPYIILEVLVISSGVFMNLFIVFVFFQDFTKTKTLSSSYKILVCLATSSVCYDVLMFVGFLDSFCSFEIFSKIDTIYTYLFLWLFTTSLYAWFTASLGFFYFIKISNFGSSCVSWMKKNISSIVPWMLLMDIVMSLLNSVLSSLFYILSPGLSANTTDIPPSIVSIFSQTSTTFIIMTLIDSVIPFSVMFITTLYSVVSLKMHSLRMEKMPNNDHQRSYDKVMCGMTHTLLFYGIYYIMMFVLFFAVIPQTEYGFFLSFLFLSLFPSLQSILIVRANPRLNAAWKDMFLCGHLREMVKRLEHDQPYCPDKDVSSPRQ